VTGKVLLKELKAGIPELAQKTIRLGIVADPKLDEELKRFEAAKVREHRAPYQFYSDHFLNVEKTT